MKLRNLAVVAAVFVGLTNMAGAAFAQKIFVVNEDRVRRESKVGKEINQTLMTNANAGADQLGLKQLEADIKAEEARLKPQTESLTKEALAANPTLKAQVEALQKKQAEYYNKANALNSGIERADNGLQGMLMVGMAPAIEAVAKEVGAEVVMNTTQVWYAKDANDLTTKVIARLDATVPTLKALQDSMPKPPAQPAAGAAKPATPAKPQ